MKEKIVIIGLNKAKHCDACNKFNAYIHIKLKDGKKKMSGYVCDQCFKEKIINEFLKEFGGENGNKN